MTKTSFVLCIYIYFFYEWQITLCPSMVYFKLDYCELSFCFCFFLEEVGLTKNKQTRKSGILFTPNERHFTWIRSITQTEIIYSPKTNVERVFLSPPCPGVTKREAFTNIKRKQVYYFKENKFNFTLSDNYFSGKRRLFTLLKFPPKPPSFQTALLVAPSVIGGKNAINLTACANLPKSALKTYSPVCSLPPS